MFNTVKTMLVTAHKQRKLRREHQEITRHLDALALTELGFPPKDIGSKQRRWFLYL